MIDRNASTIRMPDWAKTFPCRRLTWLPAADTGDRSRSVLRPCWVRSFRAALGHAAALGVVTAAVTTSVAEATADRTLQQEIVAIKAEIAALRAASGDQWLTEQRAGEIRSLVQDVLADADGRASLQGSGMTAGWDNGFFLASPDGNYRLNIGGYAQFRYYYNRRDDPGAGQDSNTHGFENARTDLIFTGHVVDPSWTFRIQGDFANDGGTFTLLDAFIAKSFENGLFVLAGQFKVPMLRETLVSETNLLAVERTIVEREFGAGRTQGAAIGWSNDVLRLVFGYTDGHPATGGFNTPALGRSTEWSFTGRADLKIAGDWTQWNQLTSFPGEEFAAFVGAAGHYQRSEFGTPDPELDVFQWTIDGSMQFGGAHLYGAIVGRHIDSVSGSAVDLDQYGAVVQGGFFVLPEVELYGRYEWGDDDSGGDDLSVLTVGANWYIAKQRVRLTADVGYGFNGVSDVFGNGLLGPGSSSAGWLPDGAGEDGQFVFRSQVQFAF